jgi:multidrug efflux system outer membrane protein
MKRPDIIQAERIAASEHARINAAYASLFPSISLTGTLGSASPDLADFLTWKSRIWAFGAEIIDPFIDGWRNLSNIDIAKAKFMRASADYQNLVLEAFRDVENSLSNLSLQQEEMEFLEQAVASSIETTRLSKIRYTHGIDNYLDVVDSERSELELKRSTADLLGWRYVSTIDLIKALGGSWSWN